MAEFDLRKATTTNFTANVPDFIVQSMALDIANADGEETFVYYQKATENFGYYFNHPQVASPINSINIWAFEQGYTSEDKLMLIILSKIDGNGKETFGEIIANHGRIDQGHGDAFIDIIRNVQITYIL